MTKTVYKSIKKRPHANGFILSSDIVISWPVSSPDGDLLPAPLLPVPQDQGPWAPQCHQALEAGGWRLEDWCCRLETGDWRMKALGWRLETGNWRLEARCWRLEREPRHPDGSHPLKRLQDMSACIRISKKAASSMYLRKWLSLDSS